MDTFADERDFKILEADKYTFFVLARIMKRDCELLLTDHSRMIICYSQSPFPVWIWTSDDATQEEMRSDYPVDSNAVRVMQYDSARGLECWTACCLAFDRFIEEKKATFVFDQSESCLLLESETEAQARHLLNWMMIPLTRAIDTILIHIDSSKSDVARIMKRLAEKCPDYVILKEENNVN